MNVLKDQLASQASVLKKKRKRKTKAVVESPAENPVPSTIGTEVNEESGRSKPSGKKRLKTDTNSRKPKKKEDRRKSKAIDSHTGSDCSSQDSGKMEDDDDYTGTLGVVPQLSSEQRCSTRPARSAAIKANKALDTRSRIVDYHRAPEDLYGLQVTR